MAEALTFQDVWKMFQETDRKFQEAREEADRKFQEAREEAERRSQEADRRFQETEREVKETARVVREVSRAVGKLGNRLGDFVEAMVEPAVVRLFQERDIAVHEVHSKVKSERGDEAAEIDLLVVNDTDVIAVECKSELTTEDVQDHIKRLEKVKRLFPRYADMHLMGAMAAMVVSKEAAEYAVKQGLFLIQQSGETVIIANDPQFQPRIW